MTGHYSDGKYTSTFTGTVQPDGTLTDGKLGSSNPVTGKFAQLAHFGDTSSRGSLACGPTPSSHA